MSLSAYLNRSTRSTNSAAATINVESTEEAIQTVLLATILTNVIIYPLTERLKVFEIYKIY